MILRFEPKIPKVTFVSLEKISLKKNFMTNHTTINHGGLYRWRENSLPIFFISETKRDFD